MDEEDITLDNAAFVAKYNEKKLRWFDYAHLTKANPELGAVSQIFAHAAWRLVERVPLSGPERTIALNLLIQAKDAACRAFLESKDVSYLPPKSTVVTTHSASA